VRARLFAASCNVSEHIGQPSEHSIIGNAQDAQPKRCQHFAARCVIVTLTSVRVSINLDHEPGGMVVEVNDEAVNDLLSPESQAKDLTSTDPVPQEPLRLGHLSSQIVGAAPLHRRDPLPAHQMKVVRPCGRCAPQRGASRRATYTP
jgi:hypothetical protein